MTEAGRTNTDMPTEAANSSTTNRVYRGILQEIEKRQMVPGQRLVETELALRYGAGRNAVREAIQRLAARGVVDLSRHRSPAIRQLDLAEVMEVLDVATVLTSLAASAAAGRFDPEQHGALVASTMEDLDNTAAGDIPEAFSRARRRFYRMILQIGGNRELQRIFPAVGMHIVYSQFQSPRWQDIRLIDYRAIRDAIINRDQAAAARAGREHVEHVREVILAHGTGLSAAGTLAATRGAR